MRVILEIGKQRRVVAGALDWPGLDRWGRSEDEALARLAAYGPRYREVAARAGQVAAFDASGPPEVIERVPGSSSTDFWGIAHVPSATERDVLDEVALEQRLMLLQACWDRFDATARRSPAELRPGPRSAGRSRDQIVRHVLAGEQHQWARKLGIRLDRSELLSGEAATAFRGRYLDAIRAANAEGRAARSWPIQFLVRRTAQHVMDHLWELEDRSSPSDGSLHDTDRSSSSGRTSSAS